MLDLPYTKDYVLVHNRSFGRCNGELIFLQVLTRLSKWKFHLT